MRRPIGLRVLPFDMALAAARSPRRGASTRRVAGLLAEIRREGDDAVRRLAARFDGFSGESFEVPRETIDACVRQIERGLASHLFEAARRVRIWAERQRAMITDLSCTIEGVEVGHRVVPVRRAACYAPGGRHPLPSSVIMTVVPARVAGVEEVFVFGPRLQRVTIAAARIAGADRVFDLGGVQAVAAAAWGLAGIPRADIVVGPGNRYVTEAKRLLYGEVGIDFPAGPSELLVVASNGADPDLVASDLLAQAEHDPSALPALVALDPGLPEAVAASVGSRLRSLPAGCPARKSLANGFATLAPSAEAAVEIADALCPEHLEIAGAKAEALAPRFRAYGSLFLGSLSAEVFGDYGSGTNHVLPTNRAARYTGGLWVGTFLRILTWQRVLPEGLPRIAIQAAALAEAEGLTAHAASALARIERRSPT